MLLAPWYSYINTSTNICT